MKWLHFIADVVLLLLLIHLMDEEIKELTRDLERVDRVLKDFNLLHEYEHM